MSSYAWQCLASATAARRRAQGSPGGAPLEPHGRRCRRSAWGPVDEPVGREFDAVLEREGGSDERVELLANLINHEGRKNVCERRPWQW